jgi:hypothetical protein
MQQARALRARWAGLKMIGTSVGRRKDNPSFSVQEEFPTIDGPAKCARSVSSAAHSSQEILDGTKPAIDKNLDL